MKKKLNSDQITIGSWITIGDPAVAEIFARAGFDWLVVDLEHSTMSMEQAGDLIRVIDLAGVAPLVRLTSNNNDQIKRVMDAGAQGIIVPMVNKPEDAKRAIEATRYAPEGMRGVGLARAQGYGARFQEYLQWQKDNPIVIVQIEHRDALKYLDKILAVTGVDGYIIGPYDLSSSMGIPGDFDHPDFIENIKLIRTIGKQTNCTSGIHLVEPDPVRLKQAVEEGYRFIAYSVDIRMLDVTARNGVNELREKKQRGYSE